MTAPQMLTLDQRQKLAKLLGMTGSAHDGERAAAALAAHRFVQQMGLTWQQVLDPLAAEQTTPQLSGWRQTILQLLQHQDALTSWEIGFLQDLASFSRLSEKQRLRLQEIADRVLPPAGGQA